MRSQSRLSMRDVADRASVSVGTVSNVINNPQRVQPATRERVEAAIAELGWVPNPQARALRVGRSLTIGLAVMDVANPFFADVLRGAQARLEEAGYAATIGDADNRPSREAELLRSFLGQRLSGVILGPIGPLPPEVAALGAAGVPTVLVDRADGEGCCSIGVDDVAGGRLAGEHLLASGHRRLAFVGGPVELAQVTNRREGFLAATATTATVIDLPTAALDFDSGRAAAEALIALPEESRPTGVFCANDMLAIGMLQGFVAHGLRVPADIALVGYDDIDFAAAAAVPLSSVAQPRRDLGRQAAELLLQEISDGDDHRHRRVVLQPQLVSRASSTPTLDPPHHRQ
ncbi:MAG: LacI family DNA-binding transcriptional regulator [Arachnia propionica]|uniref:LacI family DNA-binding transcriptional regulator n=1 Tax=Arachnia propionica TaxID=1750 RepID=UPI0026FAC018|nr:LacI family DNA-binding transcriptional regulator [Arachnia propionica]